MATVQRRENGGWQVKVRRKGYPEQSKTFNKKGEADAWARSIESQIDKGILASRAEAEKTTLRDALLRYQRDITPRKRGAGPEKYRIRTLLAHPLALRSLAGIRAIDIANLRDERTRQGLAPSTVVKDLALISHLYETARKEWSIEIENPTRSVSKPQIDNARHRRLEQNEEEYLLAAVDEPGDAVKTMARDRRNVWTPLVVRLAIATAMRLGEILALDWKYIDLDRRTAHLPKTKNGTHRDVPLSSAAVALLNRAAALQPVAPPRGKVFATSVCAISQSFVRAVARARRSYLADCKRERRTEKPGFLEDLRFHDLRHEATSRMAERLQMHELMRTTGHKDTRMLARYYHPRAEDLAKKLD